MKLYINTETNERYYQGNSITRKIGKVLFSGIPTEEQLKSWGFEEYISPTPKEPTEEELAEREKQKRMNDILAELQSMDYLTSKLVDGEDMSEYGDWQERRRALRAEYNRLEQESATINTDN